MCSYQTRPSSCAGHWLERCGWQDIEAVDPDFFKNLVWMLENDIEGVLDLTFTEESDYFGRTELVDLKPDGSNIKVTEATKREYVDLVARHRMTTAIKPQIQAFLGGFWELVPKVRPVCAGSDLVFARRVAYIDVLLGAGCQRGAHVLYGPEEAGRNEAGPRCCTHGVWSQSCLAVQHM